MELKNFTDLFVCFKGCSAPRRGQLLFSDKSDPHRDAEYPQNNLTVRKICQYKIA